VPDPPRRPGDYLSLYRRFRPQRFAEVLGQDHVAMALRNAVRQDKVAHAYLFSGPRGTGKTSTARILAKALNCADQHDGEPCGQCPSCVEIARGASLDVHELDAASNNGVDAMRDLVARAALGTPGRWKVYIVDEVHMLSTQASNALLKTLEEPPGHVVFVLATTDAQKVLPTVRSRTQHFEFRLLGPETLAGLVRHVSEAAQLEVGDEALAAAVRRGRGSARDALSALDQLAAAGTVDDEVPVLAELGAALADHDAARALVAVANAVADGRDVHTLAGALVEYLRQGFLSLVAPDLVGAPVEDRAQVEDVARRMGLPAVVRAMESLGRAQVDMRDAPDPRVNLEATLIRLAHPQADDTPAALLERLERLERALEAGGALSGTAGSRATTAEADTGPPEEPLPAPSGRKGPGPGASGPGASGPGAAGPGAAARRAGEPMGGPDLARRSLGGLRRQSGADAPKTSGPSRLAPGPGPGPAPASASASASALPPPSAPVSEPPVRRSPPGQCSEPRPAAGAAPTRDELVEAWGDGLLARLPSRARARFRVGRFVSTDGHTAVFALPNETHRSYCEEVRLDVEQVLSAHFGTSVRLRLVVDEEASPSELGTGPSRPGRSDPAPVSASPSSSRAQETGRGRPARGGAPGTGTGRGARHDPTTAPAEAEEHGALLDPVVLAAETEPAAGAALSAEQRLKQVFPGAEEL
jgi:DNA polymerase-3 subunit gamma/tau